MEVNRTRAKFRDPLYLDYFVHPLPLGAVTLMALNDHYLKYAHPGFITGKLSDFLGLFFFPLLLCAIFCLGANFIFGRARRTPLFISSPLLLTAIFLSSALFIAVKISMPTRLFVTHLFRHVHLSIKIVEDPTDMWALLSNIPCYLFGKRFFR